MAGSNDSILKTITVAVTLCVVCSVVVSTAAVALKDRQEFNKALDKKKNVLEAAGQKITDPAKIDQTFDQLIETRIVDLQTGQFLDPDAVDIEKFDQRKEAKDPSTSIELTQEEDLAKIKRRENRSQVFMVKEGEEISRLILPVYGKGLWGTMYAFLTLGGENFNTIEALVFYEHVETPGLGGEIENPRWKAQWEGKKVRGDQGKIQIEVVKGAADPDSPHEIDGLSGATITSRGVTDLLEFWLGEKGFGPFLENLTGKK